MTHIDTVCVRLSDLAFTRLPIALASILLVTTAFAKDAPPPKKSFAIRAEIAVILLQMGACKGYRANLDRLHDVMRDADVSDQIIEEQYSDFAHAMLAKLVEVYRFNPAKTCVYLAEKFGPQDGLPAVIVQE